MPIISPGEKSYKLDKKNTKSGEDVNIVINFAKIMGWKAVLV